MPVKQPFSLLRELGTLSNARSTLFFSPSGTRNTLECPFYILFLSFGNSKHSRMPVLHSFSLLRELGTLSNARSTFFFSPLGTRNALECPFYTFFLSFGNSERSRMPVLHFFSLLRELGDSRVPVLHSFSRLRELETPSVTGSPSSYLPPATAYHTFSSILIRLPSAPPIKSNTYLTLFLLKS